MSALILQYSAAECRDVLPGRHVLHGGDVLASNLRGGGCSSSALAVLCDGGCPTWSECTLRGEYRTCESPCWGWFTWHLVLHGGDVLPGRHVLHGVTFFHGRDCLSNSVSSVVGRLTCSCCPPWCGCPTWSCYRILLLKTLICLDVLCLPGVDVLDVLPCLASLVVQVSYLALLSSVVRMFLVPLSSVMILVMS